MVVGLGGNCSNDYCGKDATGKNLVCINNVCKTQGDSIAQVQEAARITEYWKAGGLQDWQYNTLTQALMTTGIGINTEGVHGDLLSVYQSVGMPLWYAATTPEGSKAIDLTSAAGVQYQTLLGLGGYLPTVQVDKYGRYTAYTPQSKVGGEISLNQFPLAYLQKGLTIDSQLRAEFGDKGVLPLLSTSGGLASAGPLTQTQKTAQQGGVPEGKLDTNTMLLIAGVGIAGVGAALFLLTRKPKRA